MTALRLILGDQLSHEISCLKDADPKSDIILMAEVADEATYVKHHPKKIAFIFSAMRHFAKELENKGFTVVYSKIESEENTQSLKSEALRICRQYSPDSLVVTEPGEYRLLSDIKNWSKIFGIAVEIREDTRFLASHEVFEKWAKGRKTLMMEHFYRHMRQKHNILLTKDGKPAGGSWNFDKQNRQKLPSDLKIPSSASFESDEITKEVLDLVADKFPGHFGDLYPFDMAVNREQAKKALDKFISERLPYFGDYQDAMKTDEPWLFHSHISYALNAGLLSPKEVITAAIKAYENAKAPINAVEGFVRQILGWREFIRGIYWHFMPDYADMNALSADRALPDFFWSGETKMKCMSQSIGQTKKYAYAHHIQRLMVIGNFALLADLDPRQVNEWYLIVYFDAYEWVEMPNVQGMILYADGGKFASKPYAASGSYINKMSDYCKNCAYNVKEKTGENACPFNYLYWDFLARHQEKFQDNHRMAMIYKTWEKMDPDRKKALRASAQAFFDRLDEGDV